MERDAYPIRSFARFSALALLAIYAVGCVDVFSVQNVSVRGKGGLQGTLKSAEDEGSSDQMKTIPSRAIENKFAFDSICPESLQGRSSSEISRTINAILDALDTKSCEEASLKLRKVTEINLASRELIDLTPLVGLPPNVSGLDLFGNKITDLVPLTYTYLRKLSAGSNQISDLTPLKKLDLETLAIGNNPVKDYGVLNELTKLNNIDLSSSDLSKGLNLSSDAIRQLDLSFCNIQDLKTIVLPPHVITLYLTGNPLNDISVLAQYQFLKAIQLDFVPVSNLTPLGNIAGLRNLGMLDVAATDLTPLNRLKKLEQFSFRSTSDAVAIDFSFFKGITTLTRIFISEARFTDLSVLGDSVDMELLVLLDSTITDVSILTRFPKLRELDLSGTVSIANISKLGLLPSLEVFNCSGCNLSEVAFLANFPALTKVSVASNPIVSIEVLKTLTKLGKVDLGGTSVADLSPLNSLPILKEIDLSGLAFSMLSQISNPQRIKSLRYSASNITELKGAEVLTGLEILNLSGNRIADLDLIASLRLLELTVSGNPLTNVKPLLAMKTLQKLDISNTQVHDLGPLRILPLKSLFARRIPLGTTIQKTSNNCPTERGTAFPLERFCLSP